MVKNTLFNALFCLKSLQIRGVNLFLNILSPKLGFFIHPPPTPPIPANLLFIDTRKKLTNLHKALQDHSAADEEDYLVQEVQEVFLCLLTGRGATIP